MHDVFLCWFNYILKFWIIKQQPSFFCADNTRSFFNVGKILYCILVWLCMFSLIKIEWCVCVSVRLCEFMFVRVYVCRYGVARIFMPFANIVYNMREAHIFINFYPFEKWNIKVWSSFRATWFMWFGWGCFFPSTHLFLLVVNKVIPQHECVTKHAIIGERMHFAIFPSFHTYLCVCASASAYSERSQFAFSSPMLTKWWTDWWNKTKSFTPCYHLNGFPHIFLLICI